MAGEVKRIDSIKNMAVFEDFHWSSSVRDEGNNVAEFKKINILYGRNYSGKTTLSRIFRAMETGSISKKYTSPEFHLSFDCDAKITQNSLTNHGQIIRVFNEDFVKENLRFIVDDEHAINSFAILGENNAKLEEEIKEIEEELGGEENKSGLIGNMLKTIETYRFAKKQYDQTSSKLEDRLRDKANKAETGIKHNKLFGDATYNLPKLKTDINTVCAASYNRITSDQVEKYHDLLKEDQRKEVAELTPFNLKYSTFVMNAEELIQKKIQASNPIQELMNDAVLEVWVRHGRDYHKGKRNQCAFCGNDLPSNIWEQLDKHFNKESEDLRSAIDKLVASIDAEISLVPNLVKIKASDFYFGFSKDLEILGEQFAAQSIAYCETIKSIKMQLEKRKDDIFTPREFLKPTSVEQSLTAIRDSFEELRKKSNQFTASLSSQQSKARNALRLHDISTFLININYTDECKSIKDLNNNVDNAEKIKIDAQKKVSEKKEKIRELKAQLKDESKGADRVNDYLNNFFGHQSLSLKAVENSLNGASSGYYFEVIRNDKKAFHLSEGECSLIAFCYFMAKLEDIETKGSQPTIWIDDPISSLDANHIFFVYSLINAKIVSPEKYEENGVKKDRERFKQLFISTHNLDFLKYLKRLPGASSNKKAQYLIINRTDQISHISLMPRYLKDYVTEFNYLFEQLYKCASISIVSDENYTTFFNFGNNTRKFFEIYLYYKYPNQGMNEESLRRFFGDEQIPAILTDRINNQYSHLAGIFERGATPIEVPEMKKAANFILQKIRENDPDQYSALLQSIGVENA